MEQEGKLPYKIRQRLLAVAPKCNWCNLRIKHRIDKFHCDEDVDGVQLMFHEGCWSAMPDESKRMFLESRKKCRT